MNFLCKNLNKNIKNKDTLMIGLCALASGSKGNCIYFGSKNAKLLIDAGISMKAITERLDEIGVQIHEIDAILITHEHIDHIYGLKVLTKKLDIPIFCNLQTAKGIFDVLKIKPRFKIFSTGQIFEFKDLVIQSFSIQHDTLDPVGLTITCDKLKVGVCTDLGFVSSIALQNLQNCHYLFVESNHQPALVYSSSRPAIYKKRVLSKQGHLSNEECADLISKIFHPDLRHVQLAHLSSECNSRELALRVVSEFLEKKNQKVALSVAFQEKISKKMLF